MYVQIQPCICTHTTMYLYIYICINKTITTVNVQITTAYMFTFQPVSIVLIHQAACSYCYYRGLYIFRNMSHTGHSIIQLYKVLRNNKNNQLLLTNNQYPLICQLQLQLQLQLQTPPHQPSPTTPTQCPSNLPTHKKMPQLQTYR